MGTEWNKLRVAVPSECALTSLLFPPGLAQIIFQLEETRITAKLTGLSLSSCWWWVSAWRWIVADVISENICLGYFWRGFLIHRKRCRGRVNLFLCWVLSSWARVSRIMKAMGNLRTAKREDGFDVTELLNSPTWSYPILGLLWYESVNLLYCLCHLQLKAPLLLECVAHIHTLQI